MSEVLGCLGKVTQQITVSGFPRATQGSPGRPIPIPCKGGLYRVRANGFPQESWGFPQFSTRNARFLHNYSTSLGHKDLRNSFVLRYLATGSEFHGLPRKRLSRVHTHTATPRQSKIGATLQLKFQASGAAPASRQGQIAASPTTGRAGGDPLKTKE